MKWLSEKSTHISDKNGKIEVRRDFGAWQVIVDGCGQTTSYTRAMWNDAFRRVARFRHASNLKRILILGLGAGGQIRPLHQHFPQCDITAVEHDPTMIGLAWELKLYEPYPFPLIIKGDATEVLQDIPRPFDLIILDLFRGSEPSSLINDEHFIDELRNRLAPQGLLAINVYTKPDYLETAKKIFPWHGLWKFKANYIGLFSTLER